MPSVVVHISTAWTASRVEYIKMSNPNIMPEPVTIVRAISAIGSLIAISFDKMKASRCTKIICCGCCEIDRDVANTTQT